MTIGIKLKQSLTTSFSLGLLLTSTLAYTQSSHAADTLTIDSAKSKVLWVGKKVTGQHNGSVPVTSGNITLDDQGKIIGGDFKIALSKLANQDLEGDWKKKLEDHLKSPDFFNVAAFPDAQFTITTAEDKREGGAGALTLTGNLTVKGISLPVTVPATVTKGENGALIASGELKLDRTKWDIRYNSGRFFDPANLGDKLIYDEIDIKIEVATAAMPKS
jgi:polyisoprenoid-binding protein YceI